MMEWRCAIPREKRNPIHNALKQYCIVAATAFALLLVAQRNDRVQSRSAARRPEPEEDADERRKRDGHRNYAWRNCGVPTGDFRHGKSAAYSSQQPYYPTGHTKHERFDQELQHD